MADAKISALPASTTPLAGTEVVPLVQSGATKQVSVANLTAGRAVSALSYNATSFSRVTAEGAAIGSTGQALQAQRTTNDSILYAGYRTTPDAWVIGASYTSTGAYRPIIFATSDLARVTVATGGDVTVNTGNLVIGTSGKGIDFSATPGTGTSELLADYEEGTWTPTVTARTGTITSVGTVYGSYTLVGRQVTLNAKIPITNNGTGAGAIIIAGMPFSPNTSGIIYYNALGINDSTAKSINGFVSSANIECRYYDSTYPVASTQTLYITTTYFV